MKFALIIIALFSQLGLAQFRKAEQQITCESVAGQKLKSYFNLVESPHEWPREVNELDRIVVLSFKSITPGSIYQVYTSTVKIAGRSMAAPEESEAKDLYLQVQFSGQFECDRLRIRSLEVFKP